MQKEAKKLDDILKKKKEVLSADMLAPTQKTSNSIKRKNHTMSLDPALVHKVKLYAVQTKSNIGNVVEEAIKKYLPE